VRLAEFAANSITTDYEYRKGRALRALGGALYRAGRFADAIRRLEEGIERRQGNSGPEDWTFLALAHYRLGHRADATRWLDRLRTARPVYEFERVWREFVIQRLRSEAEAVILYDPVFPKDPFAH
jgi:tetratricopeptide (TPR) repeat protein